MRETSLKAPTTLGEPALTVSTSAAQTGALEGGTYIYMCDQQSFILFGTNPTATNRAQAVPANVPMRIRGVTANHKLSVLAAASGTAWLRKEP